MVMVVQVEANKGSVVRLTDLLLAPFCPTNRKRKLLEKGRVYRTRIAAAILQTGRLFQSQYHEPQFSSLLVHQCRASSKL